MSFNSEIAIGDIISIIVLIGSFIMFLLTAIKERKTRKYAESANNSNDSAKKYYDLMIEQLNIKTEKEKHKKANCDINIIKTGEGKWLFKVCNNGNEIAKNIKFRFLGNDNPSIIKPRGKPFSIKILEPHKNIDYFLSIHMGLKVLSWEYEIEWENLSGLVESK